VAHAQQQLPRRAIPGTDETPPIVGLGNGSVFLQGNVDVSRELMGILRDRGGSYIDCIFAARATAAQIVGLIKKRKTYPSSEKSVLAYATLWPGFHFLTTEISPSDKMPAW
jgi:hypothetical protein